MYNNIKMAYYIIGKCIQGEFYYNKTKIQKLLYIAYGLHLARYNAVLINERPRLWPYGPVFEDVFEKITLHGFVGDLNLQLSSDAQDTLNLTIETFATFRSEVLSDWSHKPGSPWADLREIGCAWHTPIPDRLIKSYFIEHMLEKSNNVS